MIKEDVIYTKELFPGIMRGNVVHVLKSGESFIIKDEEGFELFKLDKDSNNRARLSLNGKKVLG